MDETIAGPNRPGMSEDNWETNRMGRESNGLDDMIGRPNRPGMNETNWELGLAVHRRSL